VDRRAGPGSHRAVLCAPALQAGHARRRPGPAERTPDTEALTGQLILHGRHRDKDWQAKLDLREYVLAAFSLTR
jgi:hypothetical protein